MVLCDDLHCEMVFLDGDIGIVSYGFHQSALYLSTRIIGMMQDTELTMSTLTMQIKRAIFFLVEVNAPLHQFFNLFGCHPYHLLYSSTVTDIVTSNDRIFDMLIEIVY